MLCYEFWIEGKLDIDKKLLKAVKKDTKKQERVILQAINTTIRHIAKLQSGDSMVAYSCKTAEKSRVKGYELKFMFYTSCSGEKLQEALTDMARLVGSFSSEGAVCVGCREATPEKIKAMQVEKLASIEGLRALNGLHLPGNRDSEFSFCQEMLEEGRPLSLQEAKEAAHGLMADKAFMEELERIYDQENDRQFIAHPVHYRLVAEDWQQAAGLKRLLLRALFFNGRLSSQRMDYYTLLDGHNKEATVAQFMQMSSGCTMVIETTPKENGDIEAAVKLLQMGAEKYSRKTLFLIMDDGSAENNADAYCEALTAFLDIVTIGADHLDSEAAIDRVRQMARQTGMEKLFDSYPPELQEKSQYTQSDIRQLFQKWSKSCVQQKVYKAYAQLPPVTGKKASAAENYEATLQRMVGLTKVKALVKELVAVAQVDKLRKQQGLTDKKRTLHMLFTGNPGSAKTTVARLLTKILAQKGIIQRDKLVEVGRADLVGKYVGWTAKLVKEKLAQAKGGVLFVDEAYSLCGEEEDFGQEAINVLVQEMENSRQDLIVIFAGYSDKMKEFLQKNEGLNSRIPYHLDFPDYTNEELQQILELMAEERGFVLEAGAKEKCQSIFEGVSKQPNFGNGRFVRNLLEQATAKQALRLTSVDNGEITREMLLELKTEDFEGSEVLLPKTSGNRRKLGFLA